MSDELAKNDFKVLPDSPIENALKYPLTKPSFYNTGKGWMRY